MELENLNIMYAPQKDSPDTQLASSVASTDVILHVEDASILPTVYPYPLTLGIDLSATEVVIVNSSDILANTLNVNRLPGAKAWPQGTKVARVFNANDLQTVQDNINILDENINDVNEKVEELDIAMNGDQDGLVPGVLYDIHTINSEISEINGSLNQLNAGLPDMYVQKSNLNTVVRDWSCVADQADLTVTLTKYDSTSESESEEYIELPIVTSTKVGVMPPSLYNAITTLQTDMDNTVPKTRTINTKALSSDITLTAADVGATTSSLSPTLSTQWTGNGPYTQNVSVAGMTEIKNGIVGISSTATEEQREAARDAELSVSSQTANQITITADGIKPTVSIPLHVILMP